MINDPKVCIVELENFEKREYW